MTLKVRILPLLTTFPQLSARIKNFLVSWLLFWELKEGLVECAIVCDKSWVILEAVCYVKLSRKRSNEKTKPRALANSLDCRHVGRWEVDFGGSVNPISTRRDTLSPPSTTRISDSCCMQGLDDYRDTV